MAVCVVPDQNISVESSKGSFCCHGILYVHDSWSFVSTSDAGKAIAGGWRAGTRQDLGTGFGTEQLRV